MLNALAICLAMWLAQEQTAPLFVSENPSRNQFTFVDGVLEAHGGRGWLRTPRFYSDFRISLEYQRASNDAEAALVLRALVSNASISEPAYRVPLPLPSTQPADVLRAPKKAMTVEQEGNARLNADGDWQQVDIIGLRDRITVIINRNPVGVYRVSTFTGYLLFTSKKGHVRLRNINVAEIPQTFAPPANTVTTKQISDGGGTQPKLRKQVSPSISIEAGHRRAGGLVKMEVIVLADGSVGDVRVTSPVDLDVDQAAVAAVRQWTFSPGTLNGTAVPTKVEVEMSFTITD
jgi:TonB family protein